MEQIVYDLVALVVPFSKNLVFALILFFCGFRAVKYVVNYFKTTSFYTQMEPSVASFSTSLISFVLRTLVIVLIVTVLGVPTSSVIAVIASAGVAIGLAAQGSLSNLVGGMMILFFRPFKVGDYIQAGNDSGTVRDISVFYTIIITPDNKSVTIPNGGLTNSVITNYSTEPTRRVDVEILADYNSDIDLVKRTLISAIRGCDKIIYDPNPPVAVMLECGDNGIKYALRVWCNTSDYWDVKFCLMENVREEFKEANIEIPYPQMDVHIKND